VCCAALLGAGAGGNKNLETELINRIIYLFKSVLCCFDLMLPIFISLNLNLRNFALKDKKDKNHQ